HELRTPMNAIIGFGQLLEIDDALNQEQRYSIEHINKASKHLLELINEVLDIAAIDANKLQLHPADIDLPVIISDTVNLIRPLAEQFNITVNNHVQDAPVTPIVADRQRLTQI
ncbi:MAG: histidine kinase, partial [Gammaproteobacteria bacterium]|nr:histidine kinase [Gammaproteobacteria bacterium]NIR94035.1 histidine kinase [Gammaproteobacteria bacterium]